MSKLPPVEFPLDKSAANRAVSAEGDVSLTKQQKVVKRKEFYESLDKDKDGTLTRSELEKGFDKLHDSKTKDPRADKATIAENKEESRAQIDRALGKNKDAVSVAQLTDRYAKEIGASTSPAHLQSSGKGLVKE